MFPILPSFTPKTIVDFQREPDEGALLAKNEADLEYAVSILIHRNAVIVLFPTPFPPQLTDKANLIIFPTCTAGTNQRLPC